MKGLSLALTFAVSLLMFAQAARAQMSPDLIMETYNSNIQVITSGVINKSVLDKAIARNNAKGGSVSKAASVSAARLSYTATPSIQRAAVQEMAQRQRGNTPEATAKQVAVFGPGGQADYGLLYTRFLQGSGLQDNNVADAFAACLVATYRVAHSETPGGPLLPAGTSAAVRQQFAPAAARVLASHSDVTPARLGEFLKLQTVLVGVGAQGTDEVKNAAFRQNIVARFKELYGIDINGITLTTKGLIKKANGSAATSNAVLATTPVSGPAYNGTGIAKGAQWFFRSRSGAYGGVTFEPVALLTNGQFCDVGAEPLESLNPAADQAKRPSAWGKWRKSGSTYVLINSKGQPVSYTLGTGSWFPAYAAGAVALKRSYTNATGGSVGGATSLVLSKIVFTDGTHFTEGKDGGVVTSNAAGGSRRQGGGTYALKGHTLTLKYADGRTVQKSFAIGAAGTPAHPSNTLIFIGGDAYTDD